MASKFNKSGSAAADDRKILTDEGIQIISATDIPNALAQQSRKIKGEAFALARGTIGSNGKVIDQGLMPTAIVRVSPALYKKLEKDNVISAPEDGTLKAQFYIKDKGHEKPGLMLYRENLDGSTGPQVFVPRKDFVIAQGSNLSDLSTPEVREIMFGIQDCSFNDDELGGALRDLGEKIKLNGGVIGFRPKTWTIPGSAQVNLVTTRTPNKPEGKLHVPNRTFQTMIDPRYNAYKGGKAHATFHTHLSVDYDTADVQVRQMVDELGEDYYRLMSPRDIISMLDAEDMAEPYGFRGIEEPVGGVIAMAPDFRRMS